MSDRVALILGLVVAGAVAADLALGLGATLFLMRQGLTLVEWLVFWR